ncbi:hypothetical protein Tco_1213973 [Tanacetum coccineum]
MSDMTALLNDLSYIPLNNEHSEPTQGDIGETSNEPTQATRHEFEELYASANEELYPGCLQHVAGDIDNIQSASVVMYEREFFYADVVNSWPLNPGQGHDVYLGL